MVAAALFLPWPVWLWRRENPALEGLPVAVHRGGKVAALSPLARKLGLREGMALEAARTRVESLQLLPYPPRAEEAWKHLLAELHRLTPWVEALGPGVALLRLTPLEARLLAQGYRARVGVAPWREVALLAAWSAPEGEARAVEEAEAFLDRLPLRFLQGVGLTPEGLEKLRLLGLKRVGELRRWRPSQVAAYLREGRQLLPYLFGPWRKEVARFREEERAEAEVLLDPPAEASEGLFRHLARLLARKLAGRAAQRVAVVALAEGLALRGEHLVKEPLREEEGLYLALVAAFRRSGAWGMPLGGVRGEALGLLRPARQEGLFQREGEGLKALLAHHPGLFLRVEVVDPDALAPEWGFRYRPWEVGDAALPGTGAGLLRGGTAPVGGLQGKEEGGAPPGPLAGGGAVVAPRGRPRLLSAGGGGRAPSGGL